MKNAFTMFFIIAISASLVFAQSETKRTNTGTTKINKTSATNAAVYDFTTSPDKFYGGASGAVEVEAGVWGMVAGDINQDGQITSLDYDIWLPNAKSAVTGYSDSDANMDGQNTSLDYDLWLPNAKAAKTSQVPN